MQFLISATKNLARTIGLTQINPNSLSRQGEESGGGQDVKDFLLTFYSYVSIYFLSDHRNRVIGKRVKHWLTLTGMLLKILVNGLVFHGFYSGLLFESGRAFWLVCQARSKNGSALDKLRT